MHGKTTFLLLLAVGLAACFVWIVEWGDDSAPPPARQRTMLLAMEPEKIILLSFYREGLFMECANERGQWLITKPIRARADHSRINRILTVLESLPRGEIITAAQRQNREIALEDYGLMKPRARIVLGDPDKQFTVNIGADSPLKDAVYVQLDNQEDVIVTSTNLLDIIPRQVADLRDTCLLPGALAYIQQVEIKRWNGPLIRLDREGAEWVLRKPVLARADWLKVNQFLDQLLNLKIERFVSDTMSDPAAYGLSDDEAPLQITVWQDEQKHGDKLLFGKSADSQDRLIYAGVRGSGFVYAVPRETVDHWPATVAELRDARLYFMAPERIAYIRLEEGERALEFIKLKDQGWQIREPRPWKADARAVPDLLGRLNALRVESFGAGTNWPAVGLDKPARRICLADRVPVAGTASQAVTSAAMAESAAGRTLEISRLMPGQEYVWAKFNDEPQVVRLSAAATATLVMDPMAYRDRTVLTLDPAAIQKITLKKDGIEQVIERDEAGAWKPGAASAGTIDAGVVNEVLQRAAGLTALRFEHGDTPDLTVYGLKTPRAALTFNLRGAEGIQKTLLLGEHAEEAGVYAMVQGQDAVFVLDPAIVDGLLRNLLQ